MSKTTTIIPVVDREGRLVPCSLHLNAYLWEVFEGPHEGARGCDACLYRLGVPLERDCSQAVVAGVGTRIPITKKTDLPLFGLGQTVATPGALSALQEADQDPNEFIDRHVTGDWANLDEHDRKENQRALQEGLRIFSVYYTRKGTKIWVITELDRSATTILLPSEY